MSWHRIKFKLILTTYFLIIYPAFSQVSQNYGYLSIPDTTKWVIALNDTTLSTNKSLIVTLPEGNYSILISPRNIKDWNVIPLRQDIKIISGDTVSIMPGEIPINYADQFTFKTVQEQIPPDIILTENKSKGRNRYVRPVLIITAVTTNWTAFYLKRRANDYYTAYSKTSDLSKIQHNYDRAAQFDVYSTIMLGVSAGTMLCYMYLLLTD